MQKPRKPATHSLPPSLPSLERLTDLLIHVSSPVQSQKYHLENPYWKTFDPYVVPLLDRPMDLRRHEELDTSKDVVVPQ